MRSLKAALGALLCGCLLGVPALAQNGAVKIGVLDDVSGPYAENTGPGDVAAAKFAIADFGGIRDMYLMQAKTPEESKGEWDLAKIIATVPGKEAFRPLNEGGCPLVANQQRPTIAAI